MASTSPIFFAPELFIRPGVTDISFYSKAFGAVELRRFSNDDGSIHVAELSIGGAMFHLHEEVLRKKERSPDSYPGITTKIGLFVPDADAVMKTALEAGATLVSPAQSFDYGYRQGEVKDPFGHIWMIEQQL